MYYLADGHNFSQLFTNRKLKQKRFMSYEFFVVFCYQGPFLKDNKKVFQ